MQSLQYAPRPEIHSPRVVVERHHPVGPLAFGQEGVVPVPGADVEDAASGEVGKRVGTVPMPAEPFGHDALAEIDRVKPDVLVRPRLEFFPLAHGLRVAERRRMAGMERRADHLMDIS